MKKKIILGLITLGTVVMCALPAVSATGKSVTDGSYNLFREPCAFGGSWAICVQGGSSGCPIIHCIRG